MKHSFLSLEGSGVKLQCDLNCGKKSDIFIDFFRENKCFLLFLGIDIKQINYLGHINIKVKEAQGLHMGKREDEPFN